MPQAPSSLTTLGPKPPIPDPNASDLVIAEFIGSENSALNTCYATTQGLVDWMNTTRAEIAKQKTK